jgi:hypothetical protein
MLHLAQCGPPPMPIYKVAGKDGCTFLWTLKVLVKVRPMCKKSNFVKKSPLPWELKLGRRCSLESSPLLRQKSSFWVFFYLFSNFKPRAQNLLHQAVRAVSKNRPKYPMLDIPFNCKFYYFFLN